MKLQTSLITGCFFCILMIISCKEKKHMPQLNEGYQVKVTQSAGSSFREEHGDSTYKYSPYPYTQVRFRNRGLVSLDGILISDYIGERSSVRAKAIAEINCKEFGKHKTYIVLVPVDKKHKCLSVNNYEELVRNHLEQRIIINEWMLNRYGENIVTDLEWRDEAKAELTIARLWQE